MAAGSGGWCGEGRVAERSGGLIRQWAHPSMGSSFDGLRMRRFDLAPPPKSSPLKGEEIVMGKKENCYTDIKTLLDLIANQGFPIALSILLIFRIDRFMQEIVTAQKMVIGRYWKTPKRYIIRSLA